MTQELCRGNVSKVRTSEEVLQSVFVYRKLYSLLQVLTRNFSAPKILACFTTELFWNAIGIQYAYDGHTFSQEVSQSTCKEFHSQEGLD